MKTQVRLCSFLIMLFLLLLSQVKSQFLQQGSKLVDTTALFALQGAAVSLSANGNTAIVGGYTDRNDTGAAWIYTRSGGVWTRQAKLVGTIAVGNGFPLQGFSVSISSDGNTAIVGGYGDSSGMGAAWVYTRTGGIWTQQAKLVGTGSTQGHAWQGTSVSLSADGNTAIVGGPIDGNGFAVGAAWVFTRSGSVWTQQGNKLVGTGSGVPYPNQGTSVSLSFDGNTAIVGGPGDNATWVFTRAGGVWTQQGNKLVGTGGVALSQDQGKSVSLSFDGNTAIVGGPTDNGGIGAAWVFTRNGSVWTQQGGKLVGTGAVFTAQQGGSVSLSAEGDTAIVGGSGDGTGGAWVFTRSGGVWTQLGNRMVGTGASTTFSYQGSSVSLSGDGRTALVGGSGDSTFGATWVFYNHTLKILDSVQNNWNIVSVPLIPNDYSKTVLYPSAVSDAFDYNGMYNSQAMLENRKGYWLRFSSATTIPITGAERLEDTIYVSEGWNLVGSLSVPILASGIGSIPGGIITSNFFGYNGSYNVSSIIEPGRGYWVKVSQAGQLIYNSSAGNIPSTMRIRMEDTGDKPPSPPDQITSTMPAAYMLEQNYPNPFNPVTIINYALPSSGSVKLAVYNMLGQQVRELVNEIQEAGFKSISFDASNLPSGVYVYKITTGKFNDIKKMVLLK